MVTLADRHKLYEAAYDSRIIQRLPIIIRCDGRSFSRLTKKLPKPYCPQLQKLMGSALLDSIKDIEGAVFGYQQSDELTFIVRNDQSLESDPWFGNRIQKITSITSSILTFNFHKHLNLMKNPPVLLGAAIFDARVFAVPDIVEAINNLIWRQQDCMRNAITSAAYAELGKKHGRKTAYNMLQGIKTSERENMLLDECGIVFAEHYPLSFQRGLACYKVPRIIGSDTELVTRYRWFLDGELPRFTDNRDFLFGILESGKDIFRAERDLNCQLPSAQS